MKPAKRPELAPSGSTAFPGRGRGPSRKLDVGATLVSPCVSDAAPRGFECRARQVSPLRHAALRELRGTSDLTSTRRSRPGRREFGDARRSDVPLIHAGCPPYSCLPLFMPPPYSCLRLRRLASHGIMRGRSTKRNASKRRTAPSRRTKTRRANGVPNGIVMSPYSRGSCKGG